MRGKVGDLLTPELACALGRAPAGSLGDRKPQVLIVRDTRESGPMLESALAAGIAAAGGDALLAGVLPTPAASVLVRRHGFDLAAVVSASHNPYRDNGIKFFGSDGGKLDDESELRIEERVGLEPEGSGEIGHVRHLNGGFEDYLRELQRAFPLDLDGRRIVLDCANGATHRAAPEVFRRLGASVELIGDEPDGRNINDGCGSTAVDALAARVAGSEAEIGFAFDGDGDRVIAVDGAGEPRDGDELIALAATGLAARGELGGGVAVTVMSNYGFHRAMEEAGIEVATTKVGDRYVLEELRKRQWVLGGEQSGHIISTAFTPTGDGIAGALMTMRELDRRPLADAVPMDKLPQVLVNVTVADRDAVEGADGLWREVGREEAALQGRGRVLVRASGTEPLVRVMVEAPSRGEADEVARRLAATVERELG